MTTMLAEGVRATPIGPARFVVRDTGALVALGFDVQWEGLVRRLERRFGAIAFAPAEAADRFGRRVDAYFEGDLAAFEGALLDAGGTPFQRRVWDALLAIEPARTRSYAAVARAIGAPRAVRAVGAANGANPLAIVVPCHRVVASDGQLHGYAGGLQRKAWLLAHEARHAPAALVAWGAKAAPPRPSLPA
jgi:methylated-DNA-[protein]-cysteine S-methyltransferase